MTQIYRKPYPPRTDRNQTKAIGDQARKRVARPVIPSALYKDTCYFTRSGTVTVDVSPLYIVKHDTKISLAQFAFTAFTSLTGFAVDLKVEGTTVYTFSGLVISSGNVWVSKDLSIPLRAGDTVQLSVTNAGTGLTNMSVFLFLGN